LLFHNHCSICKGFSQSDSSLGVGLFGDGIDLDHVDSICHNPTSVKWESGNLRRLCNSYGLCAGVFPQSSGFIGRFLPIVKSGLMHKRITTAAIEAMIAFKPPSIMLAAMLQPASAI